MTIRTYVRLSALVVAFTATVVIAWPGIADAFRPTAGDIEVTFDSCGRASTTFGGDTWNEDGVRRLALRGRQLPGRLTVSGPDQATVVVDVPAVGPVHVDRLVRGGFVTAVGCI